MNRKAKIIIGFLVLVAVILSVVLFIEINKKKEISDVEESEISLSMLEEDFIEYKYFQDKLNEMYPYYEPDGFTYKENMFGLFEDRQNEAQNLYENIQNNIPDLIEREREDGSAFIQPPTNLSIKTDFQELHRVFPEYSELVCRLREGVWHGGSGSSIGVLLCEIYEIEKYIQLLDKYNKNL